jgi:hypothetical protein
VRVWSSDVLQISYPSRQIDNKWFLIRLRMPSIQTQVASHWPQTDIGNARVSIATAAQTKTKRYEVWKASRSLYHWDVRSILYGWSISMKIGHSWSQTRVDMWLLLQSRLSRVGNPKCGIGLTPGRVNSAGKYLIWPSLVDPKQELSFETCM